MQKIVCEIACFDYDSVRKAVTAGADRIELCSSKPEGGVTPSLGLIEKVRKDFNVKLHVIIRPRGGDFAYLTNEFEIMKRDVEVCKNTGVDGVVFGILTAKNRIDVARNKELVKLAGPMTSTFHRAFDILDNPVERLEEVIECGFERILTSGGKETAIQGIDNIRDLLNAAAGRIIIMPGGGIRKHEITALFSQTSAVEFHSASTSIIWNYFFPSNNCTKP